MDVDLRNRAVPETYVQNNGKTFLFFAYTWQEDVAKIFMLPGAPRNVNPARVIALLVGVTNYCTMFQQQFTYTLPVFTRRYTFGKKISWGNPH